MFADSWTCWARPRLPSEPGWFPSTSSNLPCANWTWRARCGSVPSWAASWQRLSRSAGLLTTHDRSWRIVEATSTFNPKPNIKYCLFFMCYFLFFLSFAQQKKSIHIPIRSKYNRVTKRARYLYENPSCMLCNILHRYLQQADYSVIEEATMVSAALLFPSF